MREAIHYPLLGSQYYVENPIIPLEDIIVDINVDMVGRIDSKYEDNPNYIYVIGADKLSQELHDVNEAVNSKFTNLTHCAHSYWEEFRGIIIIF